ncbi:cellulose binding domain-containing protein [Streptomyces sp. NPDC051940]|uniref:cellulose binding domain-containing protein n=1 Tax=Streptomyces sp. NPDC051940 TaxID=3155675 RepID=UPI0034345355
MIIAAAAAAAAKPLWKHFHPEPVELTVRYRTATAEDSTAVAKPWLEVFNTSKKTVSLHQLTVRYYFTADGDVPYAFNCVEAPMGCSNVTGTIVAMASPTEQADHYLEIGFTDQAGRLAPGANSRGLELQLFRTDHKPFKQSDDWSFDGSMSTFRAFERVTAYRDGLFEWGKEPGGQSAETAAAPQAEPAVEIPDSAMFDNFNYVSAKDTALFKHGWLVRTSEGGPGIDNTWSRSGVTFPGNEKAMDGQVAQLRARTDGTKSGTKQASLGTKAAKFRNGTYAARIHFTDKPSSGRNGDHVNQTFYTIAKSDAGYSELDNEYLPNGGWGAPGPQLDTNSWRNAENRDRVTKQTDESLAGWHTMMMTVDGDGVTYRLDGRTLFHHDKDYAPSIDMHVNFNTWFVDLPFSGDRTWDMQIDWFYFQAGKKLSADDVHQAVKQFHDHGVGFFDTMPTA